METFGYYWQPIGSRHCPIQQHYRRPLRLTFSRDKYFSDGQTHDSLKQKAGPLSLQLNGWLENKSRSLFSWKIVPLHGQKIASTIITTYNSEQTHRNHKPMLYNHYNATRFNDGLLLTLLKIASIIICRYCIRLSDAACHLCRPGERWVHR